MIPDLDRMAIGNDRALEIGWEFIRMMYVFRQGAWVTLRGARTYLHEGKGNPVIDFLVQAAEGKIKTSSIIDCIVMQRNIH